MSSNKLNHLALLDWPAIHGAHFQGQNVLVTGGAGFIGSHLCEALCQLEANVTVIDNLHEGSTANWSGFEDKITFHHADITDPSTMNRAVSGQHLIFHLAALGSVPESMKQPDAYFNVNVAGTQNLIRAAQQITPKALKRLIFASSAAVYGHGHDHVQPRIESMSTVALSPYAANKIACEAMLQAASQHCELDTASLRFFNIFGPRQNAGSSYASVIAAFFKARFHKKPLTIYGDGSQTRDFCYVENVVHACLLAGRYQGRIEGRTFNVASDHTCSINALAENMIQITKAVDQAPLKNSIAYEAPRAGDIPHSSAAIDKIRSELGYEPFISLKTGLTSTWRWYQQTLTI